MSRRRLVVGVAVPPLLLAGYWLAARWDTTPADSSAASSPGRGAALERPERNYRASAPALSRRRSVPPSHRDVLYGLVRSSTGRPLAGATVCALGTARSCCTPDQCATTGAEGRFELARHGSAASLLASAAGHLSRELPMAPERVRGGFEFSLTESAENLSGMVHDASGGVVVEAWVSALAMDGSGSSVTRSDATGAFRLAVAPGAVSLVARAEGFSFARQNTVAPASDLHLVLAPAAVLAGHVVIDGTSTPVAGVTVVAINDDGLKVRLEPALAEPDGSFRFEDVPPGRYQLLARATRWKGSPVVAGVAPGQVSEDLVVPVVPALSLNATVSVAGEPCEAGHVWASGADGSGSGDITRGAARLEGLLPGQYRVEVSCPPGVSAREDLAIGTEDVARAWDLQRGLALRGRVEDGRGQAVAGVSVNAAPVRAGGPSASCVSDAAGQFTCPRLAPGEYDCATFVPSSRSESVRVRLEANREAPPVVLRLPPSGAIRVSIDAARPGTPYPVLAESLDQLSMPYEAVTQDDSFSFDRLPLGSYVVYAGTREGPASARVSLAADGQVARVTLPPPSRAKIVGVVLDEAGVPVVDAWVRAFVSEPVLGGFREVGAAVLTDGDGAFTLRDLWRGRYDLEVSAGAGNASLSAIETGDTPVQIRVDARRATAGEAPL